MGKPELVRDRYPQDFVQDCCKTWITRSTTDDQVVLSLKLDEGYVAHSDAKSWGHGDGFIHLGGANFALGRGLNIKPFKVIDVNNGHLEIDGGKPYRVSETAENILIGNGFGRIVVMEKFPGTQDKRVRTADQDAFFASTKYTDIGPEMFDTKWWFTEGAVQGIGFFDPQTIVVVSGGPDIPPRVDTYDALTGAKTGQTRIDVSHIDGSHIEAEGYDQGMTMICYRHSNGNVRFDVMPVLPQSTP